MTREQFNEKYKDYLEEGHYGLGIDIPEFTDWLNYKFQEYIKIPGFQYAQIKSKFNSGRFYAKGLSIKDISEVEDKIEEYLK